MDAVASWQEEKRSAYLYKIIAQREPDPNYSKMFKELGDAAEEQASIWEKNILTTGQILPTYRPDLRTRIIAKLIQRWGARKLQPVLAAMKVRGLSVYITTPPSHPMPLALSDVGQGHGTIKSGGNLRAAVFGINDGLISNASLILGMAGATQNNMIIIIAGVAGLLAGAFSMAAGEYVSVRSQREMYEYQIDLERKELALYPEEEKAELALIYQARGLSPSEAQLLAGKVMENPDSALDTLAREELGLNPNELGSPLGAAISSFSSFTTGALIPLLPFLFGQHKTSLTLAIIITALALFIVGATITLFTGRNAWLSGLRMLLIGGMAGAVTYFIGHLLGVTLN